MGKGGSTVHQTDPKILPEDYYEALTRGMLQESANEKYAQAPYAYNYASYLLGMPQTQSRKVYSVVPSYGGSRDPFWGGDNSGEGLGTLGFKTDTYEYPLVGAPPVTAGGEGGGGKGAQPTQGAYPGGKGSAAFNGLSQYVSHPGGDGVFYSADGYDIMNPRITNIRNGQSGYLTPAYSQLYQFQVKPQTPTPATNPYRDFGNGGDAAYRDRSGGAMGILDDPLNRGGRDSGGRDGGGGYNGSNDRGRDVGGMGDDTGGGMNW
jgi:hypothetical protein